MRRLTPLVIIGTLIPSLLADTWHSPDGRTIEATGLAWNRSGVILKRDDNQKELEIPFGNIIPDDVKRALQSLPFRTNDDVRVSAKTMVVSSSAQERDTGDYVASVRLYSYDGYNLNGTATISPITESYRKSGRVVEVELKSIRGDGHVGLEFYAVRGSGNDKTIYHSQCSVVEFRQLGSKARFSAPETENLNGWVVIVRSPNTGKIIDIESSMSHLEKFVSGQLPEIAKINLHEAELREEVLKSLKIPTNSAATAKATPEVAGDGVPEGKLQQVRKAAEQGDADSQFLLGFYYTKGEGVPEDKVEAVKWYRRAAEQGGAGGQYALGVCYSEGEGVPEDKVEAVKWYRRAAEQGDADAQYELGFCYSEGVGVQEDKVIGYMWFNLASAQGDADAKESKNTLTDRMTKEQITEAQKLSREWMEKHQK